MHRKTADELGDKVTNIWLICNRIVISIFCGILEFSDLLALENKKIIFPYFLFIFLFHE